VVGVIANLSLWFAAHVFFAKVAMVEAGPLHLILPDPQSLRLFASVLALVAAYLLLWRHWPLPAVLALTALTSAGFALI
jgi:chromate transporter